MQTNTSKSNVLLSNSAPSTRGVLSFIRSLKPRARLLRSCLREQLEEAQELLVEKERLASRGALMAGIAQEIKNPLNFVNNFAQLSAGLVKELREELKEQPSGQGGLLASADG